MARLIGSGREGQTLTIRARSSRLVQTLVQTSEGDCVTSLLDSDLERGAFAFAMQRSRVRLPSAPLDDSPCQKMTRAVSRLRILSLLKLVRGGDRSHSSGVRLNVGIVGLGVGGYNAAMREDPTRRSRWFKYGEPWGLMANANPNATKWTVLRRAALYGVTYPWLYAALICFRDEPTPDWPLKLAACAAVFSAIGALVEWQRNAIEP